MAKYKVGMLIEITAASNIWYHHGDIMRIDQVDSCNEAVMPIKAHKGDGTASVWVHRDDFRVIDTPTKQDTSSQYHIGQKVRLTCEVDEFKVGDIAEISYIDKDDPYVPIKVKRKNGMDRWLSTNNFELLPMRYPVVVITSDGVTTRARLMDDKRVIREATAKCSPSDTFDHAAGVKIAFTRLMGEPETKKDPWEDAEYVEAKSDVLSRGKVMVKKGDVLQVRRVSSMHVRLFGFNRADREYNDSIIMEKNDLNII